MSRLSPATSIPRPTQENGQESNKNKPLRKTGWKEEPMRALIISTLAMVLVGGKMGSERRVQTGGLPPGAYQQTCRDIRSNNYRLDASCQRNDGSWTNTWLDYRSCGGSIVNDDGNLRCVDSSGGASQGNVPSG